MKTGMLGILGCMVLVCSLSGALYGAEEWEWQGQININSATAATIELLPGVDMETAKNIVTFRESNGPFPAIDDLKMVKGIDEEIMEQIRPYISTEEETEIEHNP